MTMVTKILNYIKEKQIVNKAEIKKKFNLSNNELELILIQLRDLGYIREKNITPLCNNCPYLKSCSQECLKSEILFVELPKQDLDGK